jgi:hypothetical protein
MKQQRLHLQHLSVLWRLWLLLLLLYQKDLLDQLLRLFLQDQWHLLHH